jgi:hypothetical protein
MQRICNRSVAPLCAIALHSGYPALRFGTLGTSPGDPRLRTARD